MNVESIRQKVAQAISKAPLTITVYRENRLSDGCGGYTIPEDEPEILVGTVDGILDNSSKGQVLNNPNPAGKLSVSRVPVFITIWQAGVKFKKGDYFVIDGDKYVVENPVNVLSMNIYWQLELSAYVDDGRYLND